MREKRATPRLPLRSRCQLHRGRKKIDATLVDVSRSGLAIHVATEVAQGEPVVVTIAPDLRVDAIAWRTSRTRTGYVIGMMLSDLTPAYEAMLAGLERRAPRPVNRAVKPVAPAAPPPGAERKLAPPNVGPWWRLRVKECEGPRTRVVMLAAPSRAAAIEQTVREVGAGWDVLEALPAPPLERKPS